MSEIGNALKMLTILKSRGKKTKKELAQTIEVSEKQIQRYKDKLEQAGIYIESENGRYGGYFINDDQFLWQLTTTEEEITILEMINKKLKSEQYPFINDYLFLIDKLKATRKNTNNDSIMNSYLVKQPTASYKSEDVRNKMIDIQAAILLKQKIKMKYVSLSSGLKERVIHPYGIFQYGGDTYFVAHCQYRDKILDFKLNRIAEYQVLDEYFQKDDNFTFQNYLKDSFGIFKDDEIKLKLKITKPFSHIVKEKIYSPNQKIMDLDQDTIIFEAKMKGKTEIINWILSMRDCVTVLEPENFREEIKDVIEAMLEKYNGNVEIESNNC
ncbi:WYL domain-containing protein [Alkalibaculum sp. M08DMB]|uniref:WYL domain-containing protein n=1 Tax=Alkalibaculum sporogenes TaxID=2655001 RepID=A0A6A7K592_9FIRM|nr:transcriptional regulator [Alkalibaculum sporogenes]MPW24504.1 WYL domain-containing protein [Alkalibaculum sporogenes]